MSSWVLVPTRPSHLHRNPNCIPFKSLSPHCILGNKADEGFASGDIIDISDTLQDNGDLITEVQCGKLEDKATARLHEEDENHRHSTPVTIKRPKYVRRDVKSDSENDVKAGKENNDPQVRLSYL